MTHMQRNKWAKITTNAFCNQQCSRNTCIVYTTGVQAKTYYVCIFHLASFILIALPKHTRLSVANKKSFLGESRQFWRTKQKAININYAAIAAIQTDKLKMKCVYSHQRSCSERQAVAEETVVSGFNLKWVENFLCCQW